MNMKRAQVEFQIEASIEIEFPMGASLAKVERLAKAAVQKEAGHLSADITDWRVVDIEDDCG